MKWRLFLKSLFSVFLLLMAGEMMSQSVTLHRKNWPPISVGSEELDSIITYDDPELKVLTCAESVQTFTVNGVSFNMVDVEGGSFVMGSETWSSLSYPVCWVTVSSYSIGETEVTQALWTAVMGNNPSTFIGDNLPVENVSWDDCQSFVKKLNQLTGATFRLPTEAEWEYAVRGGNKSKGYEYSGGNIIDYLAWYYPNCDKKTHEVGGKIANELGLYDMAGNVEEWCQNHFYYYKNNPETNPPTDTTGLFSEYSCRGGSYLTYTVTYFNPAARNYKLHDYHSSMLGLRLALIH